MRSSAKKEPIRAFARVGSFCAEALVKFCVYEEIGVHSLRGGSGVDNHTVIFAADGERGELVNPRESIATQKCRKK